MSENNPSVKPSMKKRMIIMLLIIGVLLGAIVGYQMFTAAMMAKFFSSNAQPPSTVTAVEIERSAWQQQITAVGSIRAARGVQLSSEVAGIVRKLHFTSGDSVDKGDLLIELVADEEQAQLASLRASRKLAEINYDRDKQQFDIKAISQAELDASKTEVDKLRADEGIAQAAVARKRIKAPFAGKLGVHKLSAGQYINPAEALVSLQDTDELYIDFNLPQRQLSMVNRGDVVTMTTDSGITTTGKVTAIDNAVSAQTRNAKVEARLDNHTKGLLPGMFARVQISVGDEQQLLTLPQTAISYNPYGSTLFIVESVEGADMPQAKQVFVTTGDRRGDQVSILEGIDEGTQVVTSGQMKLKNGTPLIIDNSVTPANDIAPTPQEM